MLGLLEENERKGRGLPRFGFAREGAVPCCWLLKGRRKSNRLGERRGRLAEDDGVLPVIAAVEAGVGSKGRNLQKFGENAGFLADFGPDSPFPPGLQQRFYL